MSAFWFTLLPNGIKVPSLNPDQLAGICLCGYTRIKSSLLQPKTGKAVEHWWTCVIQSFYNVCNVSKFCLLKCSISTAWYHCTSHLVSYYLHTVFLWWALHMYNVSYLCVLSCRHRNWMCCIPKQAFVSGWQQKFTPDFLPYCCSPASRSLMRYSHTDICTCRYRNNNSIILPW